MATIGDVLDIPERVHRGDFVLRLTEGVGQPQKTLDDYIVTPQLVECFNKALGLVQGAVASQSSKGAYLHGSFGSGKSHFMAVLTLLLQRNADARAIAELADVVAEHDRWLQGKRFLVVPFHMIGAPSLEAGIFGQYADYVRKLHPEAPTPGFYQSEALFQDARALREAMGDEAFFAKLGGEGGDDGWGSLNEWDAETFEAALAAPPNADDRLRLVGRLVDTFFGSAREIAAIGKEGFVSIDVGLSVIAKHAQSLGYDGVVLFLDELILWLASHSGNMDFVSNEGAKVPKLVEAMNAERPIPIVSFIARQRDLRELVGETLPGAEQLSFADVLNFWEARFDQITLEDRNLAAIAQRRLLKPRSPEARAIMDQAFAETAKVRDEVMGILLTRDGNRDEFRQVYPFSPVLIQTLVVLTSMLQRERTALKLMSQLLVEHRATLQVGNIVPLGDLFDVLIDGAEPFTKAMQMTFDDVKRLYRQRLRPMLEREHNVSADDIEDGKADPAVAQRFRNDDRLLKTLALAALAHGVESLAALTPARLAALNHGTFRSPIPGKENQQVLSRLRGWAAEIGEIKITGDGPNPTVSLQVVGVDTEMILANAASHDNHGTRSAKVRQLLFAEFGIEDDGRLLLPRREFLWRGTRRECELLFTNVRELPLDNLAANDGTWKVVVDFPFDRDGHTPASDRAHVQAYRDAKPPTHTIVWLPSFFNHKGTNDLGKLVVLDHVLQGSNLQQYSSHLTQAEREQARALLDNQRDQLRARLRAALLEAYGITTKASGLLDESLSLDQHFESLHPGLMLQPPVGAGFGDTLVGLVSQGFDFQYPGHPPFEAEVKRPVLKKVLEVITQAIREPNWRVEVKEKAQRDDVRRVVIPLRLADMGEMHLALREDWKQHFAQKQAEAQIQTVTVRQLREWLDFPQPAGMPRDVQNLIILTVAQQTNCSFFLHGGPFSPSLDSLDDALELRQEQLPDEAVWRLATERAGYWFGLAQYDLRNAANVAQLVNGVGERVAEARKACDRYTRALAARLKANGIDAADRLETANACVALLSSLAGAGREQIIPLLAAAAVPTTLQAMGQTIGKAATMAHALEQTDWDAFTNLRTVLPGLGEERAKLATAALAAVDGALTHDEHVQDLAQALKGAVEKANTVLRALAQDAAADAARKAAEEAALRAAEAAARREADEAARKAAATATKGGGNVVVPPPQPKAPVEGRQTSVTRTRLDDVMAALKADLARHGPGSVVDLTWRIHDHGGEP